MSQQITPNLWFDGNAKEAVDYYVSVFPNSKILSASHYPESTNEGLADFQQDMAGKELAINFSLNGLEFVAINAGPTFKFTEAISFSISCKDQEEIDYYWEKLSKVPEDEQCGWCKDQFGLSWQVIPKGMGELMRRPGAFANMMKMHRLVIADF